MKKMAAAVMLACMVHGVYAQGWEVGAHLITAHSRGGYEAATPGLYLRSPDGITAGLLRNSEGGRSAYLAQTMESPERSFAFTVGAITGYRRAAVLPLVAASVRIPVTAETAARITLLPKPPGPKGSAALHLSLEFRL